MQMECSLCPGGVDPHVHLELPMFGTVSSDDHYTGHKAAAFGGTTTCIDFISQDHDTLAEDIDTWHEKADHKAAIDYGFHINITRLNDQIASEIPSLVNKGISSIKVFTAYNNRLRLDDGGIFQVMRIARDAGILTMLHAENGDVIDILIQEALASGKTKPIDHALTRPAWGAVEAVLRACSLSSTGRSTALYCPHECSRRSGSIGICKSSWHPCNGRDLPAIPVLYNRSVEKTGWCKMGMLTSDSRKGG